MLIICFRRHTNIPTPQRTDVPSIFIHRCKESGLQLTHEMHVGLQDRYVNGTFIDKLTKWYQ